MISHSVATCGCREVAACSGSSSGPRVAASMLVGEVRRAFCGDRSGNGVPLPAHCGVPP
ncbi:MULTISPECIES: hypothetical protein [unclassified Streptomyces]|uniref:hypothetical protein n=1 Tax=unclassified Streptomyces TaxID=2593676 RepID=UPI001F04C6B2|nr:MULTISPECIES: hypothetical protein [unclassified Streptomyces]MCH0561778.1 hypothetical protein [Streptomyces sp. MUM 2J]MCH0571612.1 hypothetical protein [Streptomyces sp. MUM 136J]